MLHIINCVLDEKFIDGLIATFEYTKSDNIIDYCMISDKNITSFNYIRNKDKILVVNPINFIKYLEDCHCDVVIIHGIRSISYKIINKLPENIKIVWIGWGYDLYYTPSIYKPFIKLKLYQPLTLKYYRSNFIDVLRDYYSYFKGQICRKHIYRAIGKINYFSGILPEEFELMNNNSFFHAKKIEFHYFDLNFEIKNNRIEENVVSGNDIIIGNSADISNNHLDVFEYLKKIDVSNKKIYVPLSYAGPQKYVNKIIETGRNYWQDQFVCLNKFIPLEQYNNIISACSIAIYFHERQQAIGGIIHSFWIGCKVFMSETSVGYRYFKENGFIVYSVQKDLNYTMINKEMPREDVIHNRKCLLNIYSPDVLLNSMYQLYKKIDN